MPTWAFEINLFHIISESESSHYNEHNKDQLPSPALIKRNQNNSAQHPDPRLYPTHPNPIMRLLAFINTGSGGNEGLEVLALLKNHLGDENVFDIKADGGPDKGLESRATDPTIEIRILVAGGDGTFSWVANAVEKKNLDHCHLVVFPLGSGNDMSRALGWGKKFPGIKRVSSYIDSMSAARARRIDVWRLSTVESQTSATVDDEGVAHGARPLMCNYFSLGADAFIELRFNQLRWEAPEKYKSRMGNFRAHANLGAKYMFSPHRDKFFVGEHVESLHVDDQLIDIPPQLQALIFLNIPSYGAGLQPWGTLGGNKPTDVDKTRTVNDMFVDDQQFEVLGLRNLSHFNLIKSFGAHGVRICQGTRMTLKLKSESTPFQVDGEPWEQRGGEVSLQPGNSVGVLEGPSWKSSSKKNAQYTASPEPQPKDVDEDNTVPGSERVEQADV